MQNIVLAVAGLLGFFLVLFSAWLSHSAVQLEFNVLKNLVIALVFGFIHLLLLFLAAQRYSDRLAAKICCYLTLFGLCCFSGLIILKSFIGIGLLAKLTPIAGFAFAIAWPVYALSLGIKKK